MRGRRARRSTAGYNILILSDRGVDRDQAPIPSLLATAGVHHHLVREGTRTQLRAGGRVRRRARGAPLRAAARLRRRRGQPVPRVRDARRHDPAGHAGRHRRTRRRSRNYIKALNKGILKVMSKMGISTLQSYCGAQIFEAVGLDQAFVDRYFTCTAVAHRRHRHRRDRRGGARSGTERAFPTRPVGRRELESGGEYQWRRDGEYHLFNPRDGLQAAARDAQRAVPIFKEYTRRGRRPEPAAARRCAACSSFKPAARAGADRRGRAGRGDRQALRHRRDVVRLDQPGSARDAGDRDEPARRQVEHRRGRRGSRALQPRSRTATRGAARSSRSRRRASA